MIKPLITILMVTIIGKIMLTPKRKISENGLKELHAVEGTKLTVYNDSGGIATVGTGHKIIPSDNLLEGDKITHELADLFLKNDLHKAESDVNSMVNVPLNQNQFDALVSFVFNIGRTPFQHSTLLKKLNEYDYIGALKEFTRWKYITVNGIKKESPGLITRRLLEQNLFNA